MPSIKYKKKTYAGATFPVLEMTKAEYDALSEAKKMDGTVYMITDDTGGWEAENSSYDNSESGLTATNVQSALDELMANLVAATNNLRRIYPSAVGSSVVTALNAHGIVFGRFVYITTRIKYNSNHSDATSIPLIQLDDPVPQGGDELGTPSTVTLNKADGSSSKTYAELVSLKKWPNGTYYLKQNVTSTVSANDIFDISFCYISL